MSNATKSPLDSPSGTYVFEMNEAKGSVHAEIKDKSSGDRIYRDGTGWAGDAELRWAWDDADRVWIYDAKGKNVEVIDRQENMGGAYWRRVWTGSHPCASGAEPCPPLSIYPDDVREAIEEKGR